jgi:hypothetical protein
MDIKIPPMPKYADLMRVYGVLLFLWKRQNSAKIGATLPSSVVKVVVKRAIRTTAIFSGINFSLLL